MQIVIQNELATAIEEIIRYIVSFLYIQVLSVAHIVIVRICHYLLLGRDTKSLASVL